MFINITRKPTKKQILLYGYIAKSEKSTKNKSPRLVHMTYLGRVFLSHPSHFETDIPGKMKLQETYAIIYPAH